MAMAEQAEASGVPQSAEVKTQQPVENPLGGSVRRNPRSVLKVSQLLLRVISAHRGLTLATLKKELGNAGYEVRRKCGRHSGSEKPKPEIKGTLLRVSGSDAAGYFRIWKIPKPKRKTGRPRLEEGVRSPRRTQSVPRTPRRRRTLRKAAKKARQVWRRDARASARASARAKRRRPRAKDQVRARAKEGARAKVMDEGRGRTTKEDNRPRPQEEKRPSSKPREEKQDAEKVVKRTIQKSTRIKTDRPSNGQGKTCTKISTKSEGPRNAVGNP